MGLYVTTVVGYLTVLIISLFFVLHYLRKGLDSSSSVKIDPKPSEKF